MTGASSIEAARIKDVVIVVPVRDEEVLLPRCLNALSVAIDELCAVPEPERPRVGVLLVLDHCTDLSSRGAANWSAFRRLEINAGAVGVARREGIRQALGYGPTATSLIPVLTSGRLCRLSTRPRRCGKEKWDHNQMTYLPNESRYESMPYRRAGRSGLKLPAISLGLWQNFGDDKPLATQRAILRRAFDLGITHFDLANNYGPPYGSAETNFGQLFREDFAAHRDEVVLSTKAGYDMWPGPYGNFGSRKYLLSSLDQSLSRMGVDYVDIFYSHRADPDTPLEETMGALHTAVTSGRALYAGISSYSPERTREAAAILADLGTPLLIHQPSYSMFNRWVEDDLLNTLDDIGAGCIAFSPLAQGLLTDRYLGGIPADSRVAREGSAKKSMVTAEALTHIRALTEIASGRGQSLAQLALAWVLRNSEVTSALIGASSVAQLEANVGALHNLDFTAEELTAIDEHAVDNGINLWAASSAV